MTETLIDMAKRSLQKPNEILTVITYNDKATTLYFNKNNFQNQISAVKPGGMTNFKAAFTAASNAIGIWYSLLPL